MTAKAVRRIRVTGAIGKSSNDVGEKRGLAAVVAVHELAEIVVIANGVRAGRTKPLARPDAAAPLPGSPITATSRV